MRINHAVPTVVHLIFGIKPIPGASGMEPPLCQLPVLRRMVPALIILIIGPADSHGPVSSEIVGLGSDSLNTCLHISAAAEIIPAAAVIQPALFETGSVGEPVLPVFPVAFPLPVNRRVRLSRSLRRLSVYFRLLLCVRRSRLLHRKCFLAKHRTGRQDHHQADRKK